MLPELECRKNGLSCSERDLDSDGLYFRMEPRAKKVKIVIHFEPIRNYALLSSFDRS